MHHFFWGVEVKTNFGLRKYVFLLFSSKYNHFIAGRSALMIASFSRYENTKEIVNLLLEWGANVNQCDIDNATALLIAAHAGNKEVCELLLEYDADIEKTDDSGTNALWAAAGMPSNKG